MDEKNHPKIQKNRPNFYLEKSVFHYGNFMKKMVQFLTNLKEFFGVIAQGSHKGKSKKGRQILVKF